MTHDIDLGHEEHYIMNNSLIVIWEGCYVMVITIRVRQSGTAKQLLYISPIEGKNNNKSAPL